MEDEDDFEGKEVPFDRTRIARSVTSHDFIRSDASVIERTEDPSKDIFTTAVRPLLAKVKSMVIDIDLLR
jgi:hypothetical protein